MKKRLFPESAKSTFAIALMLLGAFLLSTFIALACSWLDTFLSTPMESFITFLCGWITICVLFTSLYTRLYRWRWSREGNFARLVAGMILLSLLVSTIIAFLVGHFFTDIEESIVFLALVTSLTAIDFIFSKPWKELDEIDRVYKSSQSDSRPDLN